VVTAYMLKSKANATSGVRPIAKGSSNASPVKPLRPGTNPKNMPAKMPIIRTGKTDHVKRVTNPVYAAVTISPMTYCPVLSFVKAPKDCGRHLSEKQNVFAGRRSEFG